MNLFPTNARNRWHLLLFPFKAYIFVAPVCFMVWEFTANERWILNARNEGFGVVASGYTLCVLVFVMVGVVFCFFRNFELVLSVAVFAVLAFFFPIMIHDHAEIFVIIVSIFFIGTQFVRDHRPLKRQCVENC